MDQQPPQSTPPPSGKNAWSSAIASFMRHRSIRAARDEWIHVRRGGGESSGSGGGGDGLGWLVAIGAVLFIGWLAYRIFLLLVELIQSAISWTASLLVTLTPFLLLAVIIGVIIYLCVKKSY